MSGPKQTTGRPFEEDSWAPGQGKDGEIHMMTPEQARTALIERDADEKAFASVNDDDEETDDLTAEYEQNAAGLEDTPVDD